MFEQSIVISGKSGKTKKPLTMVISLLLQVGIVAVLVIIPLIYYDVLPASAMSAFLTAPPPPPPPPPPAPPTPKVVVHKMVSEFKNNELLAPKVIPPKIAIVKDTAPPPPPSTGGVVGGVGGGSAGGVLGGIISSAAPPPPPPPPVPQTIRVGGDVQAAKCISCPYPQYPPLAQQARIQGEVVLHAIIAKNGTIKNLTLVRGHPMLVGAAMQAVRNWRYHPTLLNNQPVEVDTEIVVNFTLTGG